MAIRGGIRIEGPKDSGWAKQTHCWPFASLAVDPEGLELSGPSIRLPIPENSILELIVARRPWTALRIIHCEQHVPEFVLFAMFRRSRLTDQLKASGYRFSEIDLIPTDWWNPRFEARSEVGPGQ